MPDAVDSLLKQVELAMHSHEVLWGTGRSLVASYNCPTPAVYRALSSDFGNRVATSRNHASYSVPHYLEIEDIGVRICRELYAAEAVDFRPISGTLANLAVYNGLLKPGDTILTLSTGSGGHFSMGGNLPERLGYRIVHLCFDCASLNIDTDRAVRQIESEKPQLVVLGGSVLLFPQPVAVVAEAVHSHGGLLAFDASHVAGLIAGGAYPNPLRDGSDLLVFTTCKTIPGPQHAIICGRGSVMERVSAALDCLVDGHHLHATVGAVIALLELARVGPEYASLTIENARTLAFELNAAGVPAVSRPDGVHTSTHMLLVDASPFECGAQAQQLLARAHIFVDACQLPRSTTERQSNVQGLRLGTPEVTTQGFIPSEMRDVAQTVSDVLYSKISTDTAQAVVHEFRKRHSGFHYCDARVITAPSGHGNWRVADA